MDRKDIISYIENLSLILIAANLLLLPLFFMTNMTDFFILPKQVLVVGSTLILLILWGAKVIIEGKITFRSSPFNFPIFLFGAAVFGSALLSLNFYSALLQAIPLIGALFFAFVMINTISSRSSFNIGLSALSIGAVICSVISILYYFQIFILPFPLIQAQGFTPLGSPIQHIAYLVPVLVLSSFFVLKRAKEGNFAKLVSTDYGVTIHVVSSVVIFAGIAVTIFGIITAPQSPILLPMQTGFQTAVASLSDPARTLYSFLLGSGYGTFFSDFTRFKDASFNANELLWNQPFSFSSSYFLEIVATTGIIGTIAYLLIGLRLLKSRTRDFNPLFVAVAITYIVSFLIPYSFTLVTLLFVLIAFYTAYLYLNDSKKVYDSSLSLVAWKQGLISFDEDNARRKNSPILTVLLALIIIIPVAFVGYFLLQYVRADSKFAKSLALANTGSAQQVYDLQREAITIFPYQSDYFRVFSQLNLVLANQLVSSIPQGQEPSAEVQQNILILLQQSINTARRAVALAPANSTNWENLAVIYRALIGVGENAEQFAISSLNQAIALNPTDPRLRIELGGIMYQFQQYPQAEQQFLIAVQLNPNFANAHYNLGHAYEMQEKYDLAVQEYQIVKALVQDNKDSVAQIDKEITATQAKLGEQQKAAAENLPEATEQDEPLGISGQQAQFPEQNPPAEIPGPPSPAVRTTPTPSPTPEIEE